MFGTPEIVREFLKPLPAEIEQRLADIVAALPGLGPNSRVLDVGSGTGCLIPHLQARGVQDILAVDVSAAMVQQLQQLHPAPSSCGNYAGVRTWLGDFMQVPAYMGPANAICMNAVFGNFVDLHEALLKAALMLQPGGHLLISHAMGRAWHTQLHKERPEMVPNELPDKQQLQQLIEDLPFELVQCTDDPELYIAVLQVSIAHVPHGYRFSAAPVVMEGTVVTGYGRGSRQLGVPTANMDPVPLQQQLQQLPRGVYFGWAQLDAPGDWPAADRAVHKMVMNVGQRPTVNTGDEAPTVEVHVLHKYSQEEFYGYTIRVVVAGFVRPEIRFSGLPQLLARIKADIGIAKSQLDEPAAAALRVHSSFKR
ncbi:Flavokinase-domain-containing protein [Scenedesmus sp. NREL 46B-D3]|nr:Flavokinase-domain-containing protein [Scenedesmus sp. NREL 46B-D3]